MNRLQEEADVGSCFPESCGAGGVKELDLPPRELGRQFLRSYEQLSCQLTLVGKSEREFIKHTLINKLINILPLLGFSFVHKLKHWKMCYESELK